MVADVIGENLVGDADAHKYLGGIGNDTVSGGTGDDTLVGGVDDDKLTGGGTNTFEFSLASSAGKDTITDFNGAQDKLSFTDVFNSDSNSVIHINGLNAKITGVVNGGNGGDVTVFFDSGASIVFPGVGSSNSTIDSIDDLERNPSGFTHSLRGGRSFGSRVR